MKNHWAGPTISFIDCLLALAVVLLAMVVLIEPTKKAEAGAESQDKIRIELFWHGDCDVDLWARAPGDDPVGYSRKTGHGLALTRDDLGPSYDADSIDYELQTANIIRPGVWVANAHLYRARSGCLPVHVRLKVSVRQADGNYQIIIYRSADLTADGDELTLARWEMDAQGQLVVGSIDDIPTPLRAQP